MQTQTFESRRLMGCGYIPDAPKPQARPPGFEGDVTVCIGYSTSLPEVVETSYARLWFDKGALGDWCDQEPPTPALRAAIEQMESQQHACQAYAMADSKKKAERQAAHDAHFRGKR